MTALITNDSNGLDGGLMVLRDIVTFGCSPLRGKSFGASSSRQASETCGMQVVSRNINDFLDD